MKRLIIHCIHLYQVLLSPLFAYRCRFHPTCSQYAIYAIETNGVIKGLFLTVKRIMRCRPTIRKAADTVGVYWGYDPVPQPSHSIKHKKI